MYHRLLDRWDEHRVQRGNALKHRSDFALDAELACPGARKVRSIREFCALAAMTAEDPTFFDEPDTQNLGFKWKDGWIEFPSSVSTDTEENNVVSAKVTKTRINEHALLIFHHWNAGARYRQLSKYLARQGITVVEIAMPYHFERRRHGSLHADYMLSSNLGRTIQSMRQAVLDGRKLIRILESEGYKSFSVLGLSLGSWTAGLVAAHEQTVGKAALVLTAGSLPDMVWTGRATQHIRASLENKIELADLRRAWAPISLAAWTRRLARPDLDLLLVVAKRDTVVIPALSKKFIAKLEAGGAKPNVLELNCGHYSLSLPPHIIWTGLSISRFSSKGH